MPNVDGIEYPQLAEFITRYATRYEFRLDGSSLWEGRVRSQFVREDQVRRWLASSDSDETTRLWAERFLAAPSLVVPPQFVRRYETHGVVSVWTNPEWQSILAVKDTDVFLVRHVGRDAFNEESDALISCIGEQGPGLIRAVLTGWGFTILHRERQALRGK